MTETDTLRVLCALLAVLVAAHGMGAVFARIGLPRVVGEIAGGLLLGPTVLGGLAPSAYAWLFGRGTTSQVALAVLGQLGLVLLMYTSGAATRLEADRESLRRVGVIAAVGLVVPFAAGLAALRVVDLSGYWGAAQSGTAFALVLACALAVTSIPVISRIMADLGILRTGFARTVLGVALVEDVVLYGVVAVALASAAATGPARAPGVPSLLGLEPGSALDIAWHIGATLGLLAGALALARPVQTWAGPSRLDGGPGVGRQRRRLGGGEPVDADHDVLPVLDPAPPGRVRGDQRRLQVPALHRGDHPAHRLHPVDLLPGAGRDLGGELLHHR